MTARTQPGTAACTAHAPGGAIGRCIRRAWHAKDGRGAAQAERLCALELGGSSIDRNCAAAARRIGVWLRTAGGTA